MCHAGFVAWFGPRRPARPFRKNDQLAIFRKLDAGPFDHGSKRLSATASIHWNHSTFNGEPTENRNPLQFTLEDVDGIIDQRQQCECFPGRLMFSRDDERAFRDFFSPANFAVDTGNGTQQNKIRRDPMTSPPR